MGKGISDLWKNEDWWACWIGFIIIIASLLGIVPKIPKIHGWTDHPLDAFLIIKEGIVTGNTILPLLALMVGLCAITVLAIGVMKSKPVGNYIVGFMVVFILACASYWISDQANIKYWGLSYAMWGLLIGLLISNTIGTPRWLLAGAQTELFIKTGLVLMGCEILFKKILALGMPGLMVAWIVTPIVVIFMYIFAVRTLKMKNKALAIIIAAATSVCGVSAAIATAAACRAKKEDLTLAVGMTLIFTVLMMIFMPIAIKAIGMDQVLGGAWMGGTIDSTGAVVAAGSMLGAKAEKVAAVVKMIQNVLIGLLAFCVAIYWCCYVDRAPGCARPHPMEIWNRFPKFVLGFAGASILFSFLIIPLHGGEVKAVETAYINPVTKTLRGWFFCLAFVAIGLESNFKSMASQMEGGKPMTLYIVGQTFNLILTLGVAYLAFMILFPNAI